MVLFFRTVILRRGGRSVKPTLPMNPTGWFQVAWSHEVGVGQVHRMHVLRPRPGRLAGHVRQGHRDGRLLRAPRRAPRVRRHRGRGPDPLPVPRVGVERPGPQRLHPLRGPPQPRPADQHDADGRAQRVDLRVARRRPAASRYFDVPDIFTGFGDGATRGRLLPAVRARPPVRDAARAAPAVRAGERRRLRALQVRPPGPDRAAVHQAGVRGPDRARRLHHHLRRRRTPAGRSRTSTAASTPSTAASAWR